MRGADGAVGRKEAFRDHEKLAAPQNSAVSSFMWSG